MKTTNELHIILKMKESFFADEMFALLADIENLKKYQFIEEIFIGADKNE